MKSILDGMSRAEALGCLRHIAGSTCMYVFVFGDNVYQYPTEIGLGWKAHPLFATQKEWQAAINAHYDALEAAKAPRWVEPSVEDYARILPFEAYKELFYCERPELMAEIARTNARRLVEAFIRVNGGSGNWSIYMKDGQWKVINNQEPNCADVGALTCATREPAEELTRRYPAELRLLAGIEAKA